MSIDNYQGIFFLAFQSVFIHLLARSLSKRFLNITVNEALYQTTWEMQMRVPALRKES